MAQGYMELVLMAKPIGVLMIILTELNVFTRMAQWCSAPKIDTHVSLGVSGRVKTPSANDKFTQCQLLFSLVDLYSPLGQDTLN